MGVRSASPPPADKMRARVCLEEMRSQLSLENVDVGLERWLIKWH